ncbi:MAG: gluconate 2-dehydrogenase subunit 3 family protein [Bryobacterales bacterium]|nr:gluconate 2-dehydrogenase subunit 3 family protein [Bryobacteraceae bacterium]MDW8355302.1 gluconate 2-dehydrogenase subunit 3 family protein [Bryobacterales bacterium]
MAVDRRETLLLLGAGVISSRLESAQHHLHVLRSTPGRYQPQFFTEREHALLDQVAEMILPADEHSPGAHAARVADYIDLVVAHSPHSVQQQWRAQLAAFDQLARAAAGQPFLELDQPERARVLDLAAQGEINPSSPAEQFFVAMKKMTLAAYYTSEIGLLQELGYQGNRVRASFPGCRHPRGSHT